MSTPSTPVAPSTTKPETVQPAGQGLCLPPCFLDNGQCVGLGGLPCVA